MVFCSQMPPPVHCSFDALQHFPQPGPDLQGGKGGATAPSAVQPCRDLLSVLCPPLPCNGKISRSTSGFTFTLSINKQLLFLTFGKVLYCTFFGSDLKKPPHHLLLKKYIKTANAAEHPAGLCAEPHGCGTLI